MNQPAPNPLLRFAPWSVAAGLALAALWIAQRNESLQQENSVLRTERQLAEVARHLAQNQLAERTVLAENLINQLGRQLRYSEDLTRLKVVTLLPSTGPRGETQVTVVWDSEQQAGLLTHDGLPVPGASQDYQLWVTAAGVPNPINSGIIPVAGPGSGALVFKPGQAVAQATAFGITLGPKGGTTKPEGAFVLLGK